MANMARSKVAGAVLVAVLLGSGVPRAALADAQAGSGAAVVTATAADPAELSETEKAAAGCGFAAAGGLAATYLAGPSEIALLWGGGMLVPSGSIMLAMALIGQIGASACAIGVLATPTVLWAYDQSGNIADRMIQVSQGFGHRVLVAFGQGRPSERHEPVTRQLAEGASAR